jgi:hypothetical protein
MVSSGEKTVLTVTPKKETPVAGELILNCLFAIVTVVNPEYKNAFVPILVTENGMVMDVNEEHPLNADEPIVLIDGIVIDVKEEHPLKAESPILIMIFPMITLVNPVRRVEGIVGIEVILAV